MKLQFNKTIAHRLMNQQFWNKIALRAIRIIQVRTRAGKDVTGMPFRTYSKGYLRKRERKGIVPANAITLRFSRNGMMQQIDHVVANDLESVQILFKDDRAKKLAYYHNISGAGKSKIIRRFLGIEIPTEVKQLESLGYNEIHKLFESL